MCPDKETLSAFIDNEVEGKFADVIKEHIKHCDKCRLEAEKMGKIHTFFKNSLTDEKIQNAKKAVWASMTPVIESHEKSDLWHKKIVVPFPVMAAAAVVIAAFAVSTILSFFLLSGDRYNPRFNFSETVTINKEDDFKLFERDQVLDVDLNLPESTIFIISGTPTLIREVEYNNIK